jgi:hypothetical protein
MPNDSVNLDKHIKTYLLEASVITENVKVGKIKHHKHLRQLNRHQLQLYNYDHASEYFQKNLIRNPFGYACDICHRLWYMNYLKQVKENV